MPVPKRLHPGDSIEFSISQEIPLPKGAATWIKAGAITTVRPGETATDAKRRLTQFVQDWLDREISALTDET